MGDLVQGQKALASASVGSTQGQVAQVLPCLAPTFMVNTQYQAEPRSAGKPSYGNPHRRSNHPNYGSQTGRGLICTSGVSSSLNARTRRVIATSPARTGTPCNARASEKSHSTCRMNHLAG